MLAETGVGSHLNVDFDVLRVGILDFRGGQARLIEEHLLCPFEPLATSKVRSISVPRRAPRGRISCLPTRGCLPLPGPCREPELTGPKAKEYGG